MRTLITLALFALTVFSSVSHAGTAACGIFVSKTTGTDSPTCGLDPSDPCATISTGVTRAGVEAVSCVFVQAGVYPEIVTLPSGLELVGGYDAAWNFDTQDLPDHRVRITGGSFGGSSWRVAVHIDNATGVVVRNLRIEGPDAAGTIGTTGRSSYGLHAINSTATFTDVLFVGGNGAMGGAGSAGASASPVTAAAGMNGSGGQGAAQLNSSCDITTHGAGGAGGTGGASGGNAGKGGDGGEIDTACLLGLCSNCTATSGDAGNNAATWAGGYGGGGVGGAGANSCGPGGNAFAGRVTNGAPGAGGGIGGSLAGDWWIGNAGGAGGIGQNGTGGGGGGGSGGCDTGIDSYGAGGGGGGAGGHVALGAGGGGGAGGSSFCVFAAQSNLTLTNCTFQRGGAARGGFGGTGGRGQDGGSGGAGGAAADDSDSGGDGGNGGHGGHGGGGGGGAGGSAYAIYYCGGSLNNVGSVYLGGSGATGGPGGVSAPGAPAGVDDGNDGSAGAVGSVFAVVSCVEPPIALRTAARPATRTATFSPVGASCDPGPCLTVSVPGAEFHELSFAGAVPNPASGRSTFRFSLSTLSDVTLELYDARGRLVRAYRSGELAAGRHAIQWDGRAGNGSIVRPGVYFSVLEAQGRKFTRRFSVLR